VRFTFEVEKITTEIFEIEDAELAEEDTVPARERILGVLQKGSATNKEIQDSTGLAVGTVRNKLSDLMQEGTVGEDGF
jgi:DNA-binding NarL/FixJ family response regulator